MPKMKTRKCVSKRVKQTGTGKFIHFKAGRRHIMTGKSSKRKRRLRRDGLIGGTEIKRVTSSLPYGLKN